MTSEYPREPVPDHAATRPARTIAMIVSNAVMGVPVIMLGASIGGDYGLYGAWLVILLGCAITASFAALAAHAGVRSRRSAALLAQQAFGVSGALLLNLAIAVALLGWLAVELGFIGALTADGARVVFGVDIGRGPGIVMASLLICAVSVSGIAWIGRAPILFLPLLALLLLAVIILTIDIPADYATLPAPEKSIGAKSIGTGISAIVGGYIVGCLIMPDYSRFVRTSRAAVGATFLALGLVYGLVLGAYAAAALATRHGEVSAILLALGLPAFVGLILPVGLLQNGIMCLYSSALAVSTVVRSAPFGIIAAAIILAGAAMALAGADGFFVRFLVILGLVFPPALVLLINAGLARPAPVGGAPASWNIPNLTIWCFGIACGAGSEWLDLGLTGFSAFDGFLGAAAGVVALHFARKTHVTNPAA